MPADCRLIEAHGVRVNVATGTGESLPTVALALAMAIQRMAKRNALIRHLPAGKRRRPGR